VHEFAFKDLIFCSEAGFISTHSSEFIWHLHKLGLSPLQFRVKIPDLFSLVGWCKFLLIWLVRTKCLMAVSSEFALTLEIRRWKVTIFFLCSLYHFGLDVRETSAYGKEQNGDKQVEQEIYGWIPACDIPMPFVLESLFKLLDLDSRVHFAWELGKLWHDAATWVRVVMLVHFIKIKNCTSYRII
jgi:hypothetical protein